MTRGLHSPGQLPGELGAHWLSCAIDSVCDGDDVPLPSLLCLLACRELVGVAGADPRWVARARRRINKLSRQTASAVGVASAARWLAQGAPLAALRPAWSDLADRLEGQAAHRAERHAQWLRRKGAKHRRWLLDAFADRANWRDGAAIAAVAPAAAQAHGQALARLRMQVDPQRGRRVLLAELRRRVLEAVAAAERRSPSLVNGEWLAAHFALAALHDLLDRGAAPGDQRAALGAALVLAEQDRDAALHRLWQGSAVPKPTALQGARRTPVPRSTRRPTLPLRLRFGA